MGESTGGGGGDARGRDLALSRTNSRPREVSTPGGGSYGERSPLLLADALVQLRLDRQGLRLTGASAAGALADFLDRPVVPFDELGHAAVLRDPSVYCPVVVAWSPLAFVDSLLAATGACLAH